jgi:tetratricopeptide (TPR) repeat protein
MRSFASALVVLLGAASVNPALAKDGEVTARITPTELKADEYEGAQHRALVQQLFLSTDPVAERWVRLKPVLEYCDQFASSAAVTYVSVSNDAERKLFASTRAAGETIKVVDFACPWGYMAAAFFSIEERNAEGALAYLDRIDALAPYMSWSWTERGFVLNAMGKRQEALAAYRHALDLARAQESARYSEPIALRGIGWTLVELGDLAGARQAYVDSQKSDSANPDTKAEIDYIDKLAKEGTPAPSSGAVGLVGVPKSADVLVQKVRKIVEALETDPFGKDAPAQRVALIDWIQESPDVEVLVCNVLGLLGKDKEKPAYGGELLVQSMAGNALWQLENPGQKQSLIGQQAAGARSALKAYAAIRAKHPEVRFATLDDLTGHENPGELEERLAPIVRRECTDAKR